LISGPIAMICAEAQSQGVIFPTLEGALRDHPDILEPYLLKRGVLPNQGKFAALNAAFWQGGTLLYVPRGVPATLPFLVNRTLTEQNTALLPRTVIILEPGSSATYVEVQGDVGQAFPEPRRRTPAQGGLHCGATDIFVNEDAELRYVVVQDWGESVWDFSMTRAEIGANARLRSLAIGLGAKSSRVHFDAILQGNAADAELRGVYCGNARQHFEYRTLQDHFGPHSRSDLLYKGALKDKASAAYVGTVRVEESGTRTSSSQANHNLLLNSGAKADSIPVLEILAKDIDRCSHGATAGQVDENQLFYLMSRGLNRAESHELIVAGFFEPVLNLLPIKELQDKVWESLTRKLAFQYVEPSDLPLPLGEG